MTKTWVRPDLPGVPEWRAFLKRKKDETGIDYVASAIAACTKDNELAVKAGYRRTISPVCGGGIFNKTWAMLGEEWKKEKEEERAKKRIKSSPLVEDKPRQNQPAEVVSFEGGLPGEAFVSIDISPTEWEDLCRQKPTKLIFPLKSVQREYREVTSFYSVGGRNAMHTAIEGLVEELAGAMDEKVFESGAGIGLFIKEEMNKLNSTRNT